MHAIYSDTQYTKSKHSEMGPVKQKPMQRTVSLFIGVCIALCTIVAHNIAQNRPDNFPSYPPDSSWWRGSAVEHWSLADVLSLSCARLVADV